MVFFEKKEYVLIFGVIDHSNKHVYCKEVIKSALNISFCQTAHGAIINSGGW